MKYVNYALVTFTIFVVTIGSLVVFSASFRGEFLELLTYVRDQLANGSHKEQSNLAKNPSQIIRQQKGGAFLAQDNKKPDSDSNGTSLNEADKSDLTSSIKTSVKISVTESIASLESGNSAPLEDQGFIYVASTPEGGQVKVDDLNVGRTPVTVRVSPSGIYKVAVQLKYFDRWGKGVIVNPSQVSKIHAKLNPGKGTLTILSIPQEADVNLDGIAKGSTPLTIKSLEAGRHTLNVEKGKKEYTEEVEILTGENKIVDCILTVMRTDLYVNSEPTGAKVYIDGMRAGKTPAKIENLKIGVHQIVLIGPDSLAYADSILVSSEKENELLATLINKTELKAIFSSKMKIDSDFEKAFAYVDGRFRGKLPVEIDNMRSGEHEVLIVKAVSDGSYYYQSKLYVDPYESKDVKVNSEEFKFEMRL